MPTLAHRLHTHVWACGPHWTLNSSQQSSSCSGCGQPSHLLAGMDLSVSEAPTHHILQWVRNRHTSIQQVYIFRRLIDLRCHPRACSTAWLLRAYICLRHDDTTLLVRINICLPASGLTTYLPTHLTSSCLPASVLTTYPEVLLQLPIFVTPPPAVHLKKGTKGMWRPHNPLRST